MPHHAHIMAYYLKRFIQNDIGEDGMKYANYYWAARLGEDFKPYHDTRNRRSPKPIIRR